MSDPVTIVRLQDAMRCKTLVDAFEARMQRLMEDSAHVGGSAGVELTTKEKRVAIREFIRDAGAACHTQRQYLITINKLQTADAFDPFLHREWSALLMVEHRYEEAEAHLNAAAMILQRDVEQHAMQGSSEALLGTYRREMEACARQAVQLGQAKDLFGKGGFSRKGAVQMNVDAYRGLAKNGGGGGSDRR